VTDAISTYIPGTPVPQGSMSVVNGHVFHQHGAELKAWREAIAWHVKGQRAPLDGAVGVILSFRLPRPKAHREDTWVSVRPDLDKLVRAALDALTGIAYHDDAQVVHVSAMKSYATDDQPAGLYLSVAGTM
jgi:crossover junction endodeoxyribonuclease RusA